MFDKNFILSPQDETGLAAALARLAANPALRSAIGAANRVVALRDFAEEAMIDRYRQLYWNAMAERLTQ